MAVRVAINGFGRIGRCALRAALNDPTIDFAAINDLVDAPTMAHLLKYDSVHGRLAGDVSASGERLVVNGREIRTSAIKDPTKLPWKELGIDLVYESTGIFTNREQAAMHLAAGAKRVIISAPSKDPDMTIVMGVNHDRYDPAKHQVVSNASCTTNCLAPVAKVLHQKFGIQRGLMTTIHAATNDQRVGDAPHKDWRRARAAFASMIPTTTGAAKAVGLVLPELKGKIDGVAIRVPTHNVSLVDFAVEVSNATDEKNVNRVLAEASQNELHGILAVSTEQLVSVDYNGIPYSSIVDAELTRVLDGKFIKVFAWYDNEWGFANRMNELAKLMMGVG